MVDLIQVKRVANNKDNNKVIFKNKSGKIVHLDRKDTGNDYLKENLAIGDYTHVVLTTTTEYYDYAMATIDGVPINKFIENIPNITMDTITSAYDTNNTHGADLRLLINIASNNNDGIGITEIKLANLIEIDDLCMHSSNIYKALTSLQYIYDEYNDTDNNNGIDVALAQQLRSGCEIVHLGDDLPSLKPTVTEQDAEADYEIAERVIETSDTVSDRVVESADTLDIESQISELENAVNALVAINMTIEADTVRDNIAELKNKLNTRRVLSKMEYGVVYLIVTMNNKLLLSMRTKRPTGDVILKIPTNPEDRKGEDTIAIDNIDEIYTITSL